MAESEAILGYLCLFEVESAAGSGAFVELAEVTTLTPPSDTIDSVEVTHMQSPDKTREFIPGLKDPGEVSMDLNWIPGSDTDEFIRAWAERRASRITFPNDVTWTFGAFPTSYSGEVPIDDKMTASLTCKVTSSVVTGVAD